MKNQFMKLISLITALAMIATVFTACNSSQDGNASGQANASEEGQSAEVTQADAKEIDFYSAILKEEASILVSEMFTEETGIKVNVHSYDSADFVQAFMVASNGGSPVDVMLLNGQDVRNFAQNGLLQDLTDSPYTERVTETTIEQYTFNNRVYGIGAKGGNSSGLFLNMDVFDEYNEDIPETIQDIFAFNDKLKADGKSFFAFGGGSKYMWPMWYFSVFAQTSNNQPIERTEAILLGEAKFTDEDTVEAFRILQQFAEEGVYQQGFNGTDSDDGKAVFVNGDAAAFYGGTWEISGFLEAGMDNLQLIPFPAVTDNTDEVWLQTGNASDGAWTIYSKIDPKRQSAAEKFIEFITRDELIASLRESDNADLRDHARVSCNKNVPIPDDADPLTIKQMEMLETMTFTHPDWIYPGEITTKLQDILQGLTGLQITPEEAAREWQDKMDEMLESGYDFNAVEPLSGDE